MISIISKFEKITGSFTSFKYVHCTKSMKFHSIVLLIVVAINFICYNRTEDVWTIKRILEENSFNKGNKARKVKTE